MSSRTFRSACFTLIAASLIASFARAQTWIEEQRLTWPQPGANERFGWSLAVSGDWLVVAAAEEQTVYAYQRVGGSWILRQEVAAPPLANGYGWAIAIDGNRFVVGAPWLYQTGYYTTGRAWVYVLSGSAWALESELVASDINTEAFFGGAVAIDGTRIAVGAPRLSDLGDGSGAAYVFDRVGSAWVQQAKLLDAAGTTGDSFGSSVAVRGELVLVGSPYHAGNGCVCVFAHTLPGWTQGQRVVPTSNPWGYSIGWALAIDGTRLLAFENYGSGYVFRDVGGTWVEEGALRGWSVGDGGATFGYSVALDGDRAVIGSLSDESFAGAAYVFDYDGSNWIPDARVVLSDSRNGDFFGCGVALAGDEVFVGAPGRNSSGNWTGLASVFQRLPGAGESFCAGDGFAGVCPCANESTLFAGEGCRNSRGVGASLTGAASASIAADDLRLFATGAIPNSTALLGAGPQAALAQNGFPFGGDGLRCIGGAVRRLGVRTTGSTGSVVWGPGLALANGFVAGDTWNFQVWYRDPSGGACGNAFNTTNALRVIWAP